MGVVPSAPLPTYPNGFPPDVVATLERVTGLRFCANHAGERDRGHRAVGRAPPADGRGDPLHVGRLGAPARRPPRRAQRGRAARRVRGGARGDDRRARGRARDRAALRGRRPATSGAPRGARTSRSRRRDAPTSRSCRAPACPSTPWARCATSSPAWASTRTTRGPPTSAASRPSASWCDGLDAGLVFANLVETDQVYGHRHDVEGFHRALREIDAAVGAWLGRLRDDDLLVLTADHGVDPRAPHTDHTREYAPLLATFTGQDGRRHDGPLADVGASALQWLAGREAPQLPGRKLRVSAGASRGRDDPPPARAPRRGARRRAPGDRRPALVPAAGARGDRRRGAGAARAGAGAPRQVPRVGARGRGLPAHAPAHDGDAALRPAAGHAVRARALGPRRRPRAALLRPAALRDRRAGARQRGARRVLRRAPRRSSRWTASSPARRCGRWRAGAAPRSRPSCSTSGASRAWATSTPTRRCSARASTRCARPARLTRAQCDALAQTVREALLAGLAAGRRDDRRLPPRRRRPGRLPERVPRPPAPRRAVSAVRRRAVVKFVAAGRGTYACESCQPRPRRRRARRPAR